MLKKRFAKPECVITYFHPLELNADQPMILNLPASRRFKNYVVFRGAEAMLGRLLSEFEFVDVCASISPE